MSLLNKKHILCGYSGHAYVILEAALLSGLTIIGYAADQLSDSNPYGLDYLGAESGDDFQGFNQQYGFILGVGSNEIRQKIGDRVEIKNEELITVIHPSATVSNTAKIDRGVFISSGVQVNAQSEIGKGVILNTGSILEHGCNVGQYSHIAPGAVVAGDVQIGENCFIGANSVIKEGITIGNGVTVGAGSVILNDISDQSKVVGNPGREI